MNITDEMIQYISELARLELNGEEKKKSKEEINKIITYMDILNTLDTSAIEAMSHAFPMKNVFRTDERKPSVDRDLITMNAPDKKGGAIKVPKAME